MGKNGYEQVSEELKNIVQVMQNLRRSLQPIIIKKRKQGQIY